MKGRKGRKKVQEKKRRRMVQRLDGEGEGEDRGGCHSPSRLPFPPFLPSFFVGPFPIVVFPHFLPFSSSTPPTSTLAYVPENALRKRVSEMGALKARTRRLRRWITASISLLRAESITRRGMQWDEGQKELGLMINSRKRGNIGGRRRKQQGEA